MTKVNRHRTYGMTPEWRIIAKSLIEPGMGTGRPLLNCDVRKPVRLTRNGRTAEVDSAGYPHLLFEEVWTMIL
jgi:hypothetical protein